MEWVVLTVWNTLGTQKLRNPPTPKQKQFGRCAYGDWPH
jgi:hypothetical protein